MSKSKQHSNRATQALRRQRRSLPKKVLDIERHFIDDLMTREETQADHRLDQRFLMFNTTQSREKTLTPQFGK